MASLMAAHRACLLDEVARSEGYRATARPTSRGSSGGDKMAFGVVTGFTYPPCPQGVTNAVPGTASCPGVVVPVPVVAGMLA